MRLCSSILSLAAMLLLYNSGHAQEKPVEPVPAKSETKPAANTRLKIGVALEGGGALGIAHLGVLKWFEEHHIPIDYVAGTSMGGLVGGLYATGKSTDELKQIVDHATGHSCWAETFPTGILHFAARKTPATFRIISKSA
jgi:NTE family protein